MKKRVMRRLPSNRGGHAHQTTNAIQFVYAYAQPGSSIESHTDLYISGPFSSGTHTTEQLTTCDNFIWLVSYISSVPLIFASAAFSGLAFVLVRGHL
jgi:hypothetical protein